VLITLSVSSWSHHGTSRISTRRFRGGCQARSNDFMDVEAVDQSPSPQVSSRSVKKFSDSHWVTGVSTVFKSSCRRRAHSTTLHVISVSLLLIFPPHMQLDITIQCMLLPVFMVVWALKVRYILHVTWHHFCMQLWSQICYLLPKRLCFNFLSDSTGIWGNKRLRLPVVIQRTGLHKHNFNVARNFPFSWLKSYVIALTKKIRLNSCNH